jgi:hypothetical protein
MCGISVLKTGINSRELEQRITAICESMILPTIKKQHRHGDMREAPRRVLFGSID